MFWVFSGAAAQTTFQVQIGQASPNEVSESIALACDGGYVVVADNYVVKLRPDGSIQWQTALRIDPAQSSDSIYLSRVVRTQDGGYAVAGELWQGLTQDIYLAKLDDTGLIQ